MFFKNQAKQNGFMLIEVMIAVALLGIGSISIMNLQINTLGRVRQAQVHLEHLFKLQNLFFDPEVPKNGQSDGIPMRVLEIKDQPDFKTFKYEILPVAKKSELNRFADLYLMQAVGSWTGFNRDYEDNLVGLIYIAPKQSELPVTPEKEAPTEGKKTPNTKPASAKLPDTKKPSNEVKRVKTA